MFQTLVPFENRNSTIPYSDVFNIQTVNVFRQISKNCYLEFAIFVKNKMVHKRSASKALTVDDDFDISVSFFVISLKDESFRQ